MNKLRELRKEAKKTQQEIADFIGVTKRSYIYWENEERQIKPEKAHKLAEYFDVSVGYLLGFSSYRNNQDAIEHVISDDPLNPFAPVKARILTLTGDTSFQKLEENYVIGDSWNDIDYDYFVSFLSAVDKLSYREEETLLLNFGLLSSDDKKVVQNLTSELARKYKRNERRQQRRDKRRETINDQETQSLVKTSTHQSSTND